MKGIVINGLNKTQRKNRKQAEKFGGRNWYRARKKILPTLLAKQKGLCNWCKQPFDPFNKADMTVDHIKPASEGGTRSINKNYQVLHAKCHAEKDRENNRKFGKIGSIDLSTSISLVVEGDK